jgi:hypothetical protein
MYSYDRVHVGSVIYETVDAVRANLRACRYSEILDNWGHNSRRLEIKLLFGSYLSALFLKSC